MAVVFTAGLAINSAGNFLTGLSEAVAVALMLQTVRGLGIAAGDVGSTTLLQRMVPAEMTGRVFGNLYGLIGVSAGLSYVAGGLFLNATSARTTFLVAGSLGMVAAAVTGWRLAAPGSGDQGDLDRLLAAGHEVEALLELGQRELVGADLVHRQHAGLDHPDRGGPAVRAEVRAAYVELLVVADDRPVDA